MKYLLIIGDGMADYPCRELGGRTPLEAANIPNMDEMARKGRCGTFLSLPEGLSTGSAVANLSILGYDPKTCFEGRGVLEAAAMGVDVREQDVVLRCNLICVESGRIKSHSAGNITDVEAAELIRDIKREFEKDNIYFHNGVSYRHVLLLRGHEFSKELITWPPHDKVGTSIEDIPIKPVNPHAKHTASVLNEMILTSNNFLQKHPVNKKRKAQGMDEANYIWPWSPGKKPKMKTFKEKFGITGSVISAVDLIKGTGLYAGLEPVSVPGATGIYTTNYEGKAAACIERLRKDDFVLVHVEASDEAAHEGNLNLKIRTIEYLDQRLIGNILKEINKVEDNVAVALLPDHFTPVIKRTHSSEPVPFVIYNPLKTGDDVAVFNEKSVLKGSYKLLKGDSFIRAFIER
ncbi:MAG: cofactor-independent phosphoglycerate mutase [bacterium]